MTNAVLAANGDVHFTRKSRHLLCTRANVCFGPNADMLKQIANRSSDSVAAAEAAGNLILTTAGGDRSVQFEPRKCGVTAIELT